MNQFVFNKWHLLGVAARGSPSSGAMAKFSILKADWHQSFTAKTNLDTQYRYQMGLRHR
jgi:hypothetical protein